MAARSAPKSPRSAWDPVYEALDAQFSKEEQLKLTLAINVINGWNGSRLVFNPYASELGWQ